jgi:hypothetical protein
MQFSKEEYLIIFIAFVYGFVAQEFFQGWGKILRSTKRNELHEIYWYHLFWTFLTFGLLITFWWDYWDRSAKIAQNIGFFMVTLIPPLNFYLISMIIFPAKLGEGNFDLHDYFTAKLSLVIWLFATLLSSDLVITLITGVDKISDALFLAFAIILAIFAAAYPKKWSQWLTFALAWVILLAHFFVE